MEIVKRLAGLAIAVAFAVVPMKAQGTSGVRIRSIAHARSAPLRSYAPGKGWKPGMPPRVIPWRQPKAKGGKPGGGPGGGGGGNWSDADVQGTSAPQQIKLGTTFQGIGFTGAIPPDENLSVGINNELNPPQTQIVQIVNTSYEVYDTSGNPLAGNDLAASIFSALPSSSLCAQVDGGDTIALFDQLHGDHWLISQLAYNSDFSQNDLCLAISDNSDATGNYEVYDIPFGNHLPDYPKLAVWSDGIYFSANMFRLKVNPITGSASSTFLGAQACSFPSSDVTTAQSSVTFTCSGGGNTGIYNILPADVDGPTAPTTTGDYYLQFLDNLNSTSGNTLRLYQFNSGSLVALSNLTVNTFHEACGGGTCVPQLGTTQLLDSLGDRLMYRLSYRNYGSSQQMAVNQSVQVKSSSQQTGVRWYQLCSQSGSVPFYVCKESTFSPDSTTYRWMGSIAQNKWGDLGFGYSTSSSSDYPSIAITGMSTAQNGGTADNGMEPEQQIFAGQGYQDTYSRWGDYSGMAVDPTDDCTFWYTNEYLTPPNGFIDIIWGTVIGSFTFPNCQ